MDPSWCLEVLIGLGRFWKSLWALLVLIGPYWSLCVPMVPYGSLWSLLVVVGLYKSL